MTQAYFFLLLAAALALMIVPLPGNGSAIWPQPAMMTNGNNVRTLSESFTITPPPGWNYDKDFQTAVERTLKRIKSQSIKPFNVARSTYNADKRGADLLHELQINIGKTTTTKRSMHVFNTNPSTAVDNIVAQQQELDSSFNASKVPLKYLSTAPLENYDESYILDIPSEGDAPATLQVTNALAAVRGLATFAQLVYSTTSNDAIYIDSAPVHIEDDAAYPYRGIMLDTARNYLSPAMIKRQLDAMELLKLNQLHWHITDTASWPLGLTTKGLNVLAEKGAYAPDMVYDKETIEDLVTYAMQRGINIIMEIDMPGHQFMGVKDYGSGDLIVCGDETNWLDWANEPPSGQLDIRKPAAAQLMNDIMSEIAQYLPGPYISTGNDEVEAQCYGLKKGDLNGTDVLLAPFIDSVHSHLRSLSKTPMVWEEAALNYPQTAARLANGTLVEAWTGSANVERLLKSSESIRLVHAPADYFYLDCGQSDFLGANPGGASWCSYVSWQQQYSFDPLNGTQSVQGGAERVMGGESALWAEQVDEANLESLLWPRAAAGAEVFWTGAEYTLNADVQARSAAQALPRLHEARARLRTMDIRSAPLQPFWCALRPGRCDMPHSQVTS